MNKKKFLYIANWKMNMPFNKALKFINDYKDQLNNLAQTSTSQIVICPELPILAPISQELKHTSISVGAQNCSEFKLGAYTGDVSAQTIQEAGCGYCIVGHSERRSLFKEDNNSIAQKVMRIIEQNMQPIICFGETQEEYVSKNTLYVLEQQLSPIIRTIQQENKTNHPLCLAYEPIWSIGTGLVAEPSYLQTVFEWVQNMIHAQLPTTPVTYIYGGSVNENNAQNLKHISGIEGFLIGGASLDFQKFQKIVL